MNEINRERIEKGRRGANKARDRGNKRWRKRRRMGEREKAFCRNWARGDYGGSVLW